MGRLRELMDRYYRTLDTEGVDALHRYWSTTCEFAAPGARGRGPDLIRGWIRIFCDANPGYLHTVIDSVEGGDTIALELMVEATFTAPLRLPAGDISPTGKAWRLPICVVVRFGAGVFTSYHIYFDTGDLLREMGVTVAPEPAIA